MAFLRNRGNDLGGSIVLAALTQSFGQASRKPFPSREHPFTFAHLRREKNLYLLHILSIMVIWDDKSQKVTEMRLVDVQESKSPVVGNKNKNNTGYRSCCLICVSPVRWQAICVPVHRSKAKTGAVLNGGERWNQPGHVPSLDAREALVRLCRSS